MDFSKARLGLSPNLHWIGDIVGATTVYLADDITAHSDSGPWAPNSQYDFFDDGATLYHQPWTARSASGPVAPPTPISGSGVYVGSGSTDANGQFSQHKSAGPARRWDIWSYLNQKQIDLQVVDATGNLPAITATQGNWHPLTPNSFAEFIIGLPESANAFQLQQVYPLTSAAAGGNSCWGVSACGWGAKFANPVPWTWPDLTGMPQGYYGQIGSDTFETVSGQYQDAPGGNNISDYTSVDNVGVQQVWAVYIASALTGAGAEIEFMGKNAAHRIMHVRFLG